MFFQTGDCFEVAGHECCKVVFANEDFFVARNYLTIHEEGKRDRYEFLGDTHVYSNNADYLDKYLSDSYWIKKVPSVEVDGKMFRKMAINAKPTYY
jgi:hypothetical protein